MKMQEKSIYQEIAARTGGDLYIGVVGPVRSGKSTFVKRFMETMVLPRMDDKYALERARDELPQCSSGRTIMTAEPKFVPENAAQLLLDNGTHCAVRLMDSVGFMIPGASGCMEDGAERMVMTPWYDHEIPITQAAEEGTYRVIADHSTIGVLVTTDGSVCGIPRDDYAAAEELAVDALRRSGKPFVILLNCEKPKEDSAVTLAEELSAKYGRRCVPVNCLNLDEAGITEILCDILMEFPITCCRIYFPPWMEALGEESEERRSIFELLRSGAEHAERMGDLDQFTEMLAAQDVIDSAAIAERDLSSGTATIRISVPKRLYYEAVSRESGFAVHNDRELMLLLRSVSARKEEYDRVYDALESARTTGYGIIMPRMDEMKLEEPQIVRQGGRYSVRLKASAPSIHMILANIETEVSPAIGGEKASEEVINFLLQGYDGDVSRIWESNIFGKPLNDIAGEGLNNKIRSMPADAQNKLRMTIQRIINEGNGGIICIIL